MSSLALSFSLIIACSSYPVPGLMLKEVPRIGVRTIIMGQFLGCSPFYVLNFDSDLTLLYSLFDQHCILRAQLCLCVPLPCRSHHHHPPLD